MKKLLLVISIVAVVVICGACRLNSNVSAEKGTVVVADNEKLDEIEEKEDPQGNILKEDASKSASEVSSATIYGPYKVEKILDGNTVEVDIDGEKKKIRLIGIDIKKVSYTEKILLGKYVKLEFDKNGKKENGAYFSYLYIKGKMFNKTALKTGEGRLTSCGADTKYIKAFKRLQSKAQSEKKGIWKQNN